MIASNPPGRIWEEATSPDATQRARDFEARWRGARGDSRPDPTEFLPLDASANAAGVLLALLRADLTLRREGGETIGPESYRARYPELRDDVLVALIYEDFCLREEAGETPDPTGYYERFPSLAAPLREILEIHDLIRGSVPPSLQARGSLPSDAFFSETRQTIGGFFLVEELGRGSFARVFLARERQLADRLVALKVSKTGSREPQALARLQHTNIVPVHSYRIDPATGLHLLCMPYFGRVTLAKLLDDPDLRAARSGAALVATLDRLVSAGDDESQVKADAEPRRNLRHVFARRSYARAIAWWGAQLADALRHAHDRGVLHRDLKPSNILIAGDGTPMILDFNLAREVELPTDPAARTGGTLAYMAPEHLAALIEGRDQGVDHRADLYALGLILFEMLGSKPLDGSSRTESPQRLLDRRRLGPPASAVGSPRVPPALAAVIRRCLQAHPADRYGSAGDLATDLRAVAADAPLQFAREPWLARGARWVRNNVATVVGGGVVAVLVAGGLTAWFQARSASLRREIEVARWLQDGIRSADAGEFRAAAVQFDLAADRTEGHPALAAIRRDASARKQVAETASAAQDQASAFLARAEHLQFAILGFGGNPALGSRDLAEAFRPLGVLTALDWTRGPLVAALPEPRRSRLIREVDDLLYLWVVAAARAAPDPATPPATRRDQIQNAVTYCDQALAFSAVPAPWIALRQWWQAQAEREPARPSLPSPSDQVPAGTGFRWYLLGMLGTDRAPALAWLEAAVRRAPENYWHQFVLGFEHARDGRWETAQAHYAVAIALRPDFPWAWENRALLAEDLGEWAQALADLGRAQAACQSPGDQMRVRIEQGRIHQRLGDFRAARAAYDAVVALDPTHPLARDAGRDRARLEAAAGATAGALALYDTLIATDPRDWRARQGRANLALRQGHPVAAERDLDFLIDQAPAGFRAQAFGDRAATRLTQGRPGDAWNDLQQSASLASSPRSRRLLDRIKLALGRDLDPWPATPEAFDTWPEAGNALRADLRRAADRLATLLATGGHRPDVRRDRAVLLAALGDPGAALLEADRLVGDSPRSAEARLIRARISRRAGQLGAALADIAEGLALEPDDPPLSELRGLIRVDQGDFAGGCADLTVASARGAASARGPALALALGKLGRLAEAAELWSQLAEADPTDVRAHLGLAIAWRHLRQWDRSLASLEAAAALVEPRSRLLGRLALAYLACLPARPDRLPRVVTLGRLWVEGWWPLHAGPSP